MATVIDSFLVELGLDPSKYREGQREAREEQRRTKEEAVSGGKEIEERGRKTAEVMNKVRHEVLGLFAAFTAGAGIREFIQNTITGDAATGRLAKQIGVATDELSAWQGVARRTGGTNEDATNSLQALAGAFQDIQLTGQSPLIPYLQTLRISLKDLSDPTETLLKMADAFGKMDPRRAAALGRGMGLSPTMITVLSKGREEVSRLLAEQRKLGVTTEADAKSAQMLQNTLESLSTASARLGRNLLLAVAPALEKVGQWFVTAAQWAQTHGRVVEGVFVGLAAAMVALTIPLIASAAPFVALAAAIAAAGAAGGALVTDLAPLQAALAALSDAFAQLAASMQRTVAAVDPQVWVALGRVVTALAVGAIGLLTGAVIQLGNSFRLLVDVVNTVAAALRGDWTGAFASARQVGSDALRVLQDGFKQTAKTATDMWNAIRGKKAPGVGATPAPPAAAKDTSIEGFFRSHGWSATSARGIAAGVHAESGGNPAARNPTSGAYGLGQWLGSRKTDFQRVIGRPLEGSSRDEQLRFMQWELNNTERRAGAGIYGAATDKEALDVYVRRFMRPAPGGETAGDLERGGRYLAQAPTAAGGGRLAVVEPGLARGARAAAPARGATNDNRSTTDVQIGSITVQTSATDANGIARSIGGAVQKRAFVTQANTGTAG